MRPTARRAGLGLLSLALAGLTAGCVAEESVGWSSSVTASADSRGMSAGDSLGHALHSSNSSASYARADEFESALLRAAAPEGADTAIATVPDDAP